MAVMAIGGVGCRGPSAEALNRLAETKRGEAELNQVLSDLEERMLGVQATVQVWQELGRRHRQVSAIACENAGQHLDAIERHAEHQHGKQHGKRPPFASAKAEIGQVAARSRVLRN
jgi:hypothetical protein